MTRREQTFAPLMVRCATKPERAREMVLRALDSGLPVAWVAGDEVYGNAPLRPSRSARPGNGGWWPDAA